MLRLGLGHTIPLIKTYLPLLSLSEPSSSSSSTGGGGGGGVGVNHMDRQTRRALNPIGGVGQQLGCLSNSNTVEVFLPPVRASVPCQPEGGNNNLSLAMGTL